MRKLTEKATRDVAAAAAGEITTRLFLGHFLKEGVKPNNRQMLAKIRQIIESSVRRYATTTTTTTTTK